MKALFLLLLCAYSWNGYAQKKGHRPYFKLAPSMFLVKGSDPSPGVIGGFGGQLNRYATLGPAGGYFKLDGYRKGIVPLGLDLTVTDYGKHKVQPVFTMQAFYPAYEEVYRTGSTSITVRGRFMMSASAGISLPMKGKSRLLLTGGYSQLVLRSDIKSEPRTVIEVVPISLTMMF
jgi:hypothetical protein